ncbi:hypothetical protein FD04_GL000817 [Secundilactobacillus odoratitofui DSM 19909 = JCM 15043]|uniref:NAD(P)-binding domain-containing protein n=1 Tax=Secundilactobacillus odoratitofui DSM 19909 = JCM 15043 TaxID=1423776 RepID=A0A0R1LPR4_9LACO|nr:NAD(P)H-binding protein [Secundilactobacillus odoratitofui]KRK97845.1 hypothetical protein FD04_GL000817 [Secundilactobacillus odoratitofui DSM 19909 = JCM 15043]
MTNILIIGATGTVGSATRQYLLTHTDDQLTLMARHVERLGKLDSARETAISGSVMDDESLKSALAGQDVVFAALSGNLPAYAQALVDAMSQVPVKRLLFITSMGIYDEIPTELGGGNVSQNPVLRPYRQAADIIEDSDLNYTIIRPGWFDHQPDTNYQVTHKGEPFGGHDVAVESIADLVMKLAHDSKLGSRDSLGINRRN